MQVFRQLYKAILPVRLRKRISDGIDRRRHKAFLDGLRAGIVGYYDQKENLTPEEDEVVAFVREHGVEVFPYPFRFAYDAASIRVFRESPDDLPYVWHEGKKLYFKRSLSDKAVRSLYFGLQLDQDEASPHRYVEGEFGPKTGDILADLGAAEGNFSLSHVETAKHVHLFEPDPEWIEALTATFAPWREKVTIHPKFIGNKDGDGHVSLDTFLLEHDAPTFVKADIEGAEADFLEGATGFLSDDRRISMAICTYHKQNDASDFTRFLTSKGFEVAPSRGYMLFYFDPHIAAPYLRRGILRATKNGG